MIRANKLTQLEGPRNVAENGKFGENGEFVEVDEEMIRANKLNELKGPEMLAKFGQDWWTNDKSESIKCEKAQYCWRILWK